MYFISKKVSGGSEWGMSRNGNEQWGCFVTNDTITAYAGNTYFRDANWHHVMCIYNGTNVIFYIDGVQSGSIGSLTGPVNTRGDNVVIGSSSGTASFWNGTIDEVVIFARALNESEILTLNNTGFDSLVLGCGDGILEEDFAEECDDGNTDNDDGCSSECLIEVEGAGIIEIVINFLRELF